MYTFFNKFALIFIFIFIFIYIYIYFFALLFNVFFCFASQLVRKEMDGFERLFGRFLAETGPSIEWEKIRPVPDDAVSFKKSAFRAWPHWKRFLAFIF